MDTNHPYWKYAEMVNGRLAMLGLIIGTINYVLFGEIAPGFFNETQFTIIQRYKFMTPEAERFNGWAAMLGFVAAVGAYATTGNIIPGIF